MTNPERQTRRCRLAILLDPQVRHRLWIRLMIAAAAALALTLVAYGWDYYILAQAQRPFSLKHDYLKPSGTTGLRLGIAGIAIFVLIYLYPLRKYWQTLGRIGKTKNWLDFHVTLGLIAPVVISFHCAFKTGGFAGMAYWVMIALTTSGIVGRYFYAQIPRSIGAAELSLNEMQTMSTELMAALGSQNVLSLARMERLFRLPDAREVQSMPTVWVLAKMVWLDVSRPFEVWALRRSASGVAGRILSLGGVLHGRNVELEKTISLASSQAALAKRILFLSRTHRVFHLWHVVHRPFSLSFAIFVIIHVSVVVWLGYF